MKVCNAGIKAAAYSSWVCFVAVCPASSASVHLLCLLSSCSQLPDAPWGIISIKAQDEDHETPMQPITMMRNALGREEGGSGVPLDRQQYEAAVAYWDSHAAIL